MNLGVRKDAQRKRHKIFILHLFTGVWWLGLFSY
jgi:hypothetical protein